MAQNTGTRRDSGHARSKSKMVRVDNDERRAGTTSPELATQALGAASALALVGRDRLDSPTTKFVNRYPVPLMPFPVIVIDSAIEAHLTNSSSVPDIQIPALPKLLECVAIERVCMPNRFAQQEITFLRKCLALTGRKFAELLEVTPETVSRWENGRDPMGPHPERLLRFQVLVAFAREMSEFPQLTKCIGGMTTVPTSTSLSREALLFKYVPDDKGGRRWISVRSNDNSAMESAAEPIPVGVYSDVSLVDLCAAIVAVENTRRETNESFFDEYG